MLQSKPSIKETVVSCDSEGYPVASGDWSGGPKFVRIDEPFALVYLYSYASATSFKWYKLKWCKIHYDIQRRPFIRVEGKRYSFDDLNMY